MKILICGDYIVHNILQNNSVQIFGDFLEVIQQSDIAIYNQEHPVSFCKEMYPPKRFGTTVAAIQNYFARLLTQASTMRHWQLTIY